MALPNLPSASDQSASVTQSTVTNLSGPGSSGGGGGGGGGGGTVTQVNSGAALSGGPINTTGTLNVVVDAVTIEVNGSNQLQVIGAPPSGAAGGDLTGTYPNPTLAAIGSSTGPDGDATHSSRVTIDAKGRVTALSAVAITGTPPGGSAGGDLTGTYPNPTLAAIGSATGPIGDASHVAVTTIDAKGRVTALTSTAITAAAVLPLTTLGDMLYENATPAPARLPGITSAVRRYLAQTGTGSVSAAPSWTLAPRFNVEDYGASVTGSASANVTAINAAFTAILTQGWGCLYLPGLYPVNAILTFNMGGSPTIYNFSIVGDGMGVSGFLFQGTTTNNGVVIDISATGSYWANFPNVSLRDLSIISTVSATTTALTLTGNLTGARTGTGPHLHQVEINFAVGASWTRGIDISEVLNTVIDSCHIVSNNVAGAYGIYFHGGGLGDEMRVCNTTFLGWDRAFYADGTASGLEGIYLMNDDFTGNNWGIYLDNGSNPGGSVKLIGNYMAGATGGIFTKNFGGCEIIGNQFDPIANGTTGISCYNAFQSNIIGNHVGGNAGTSAIGIKVDGDGGGTYNLGTMVDGNMTVNVATAVQFTANTGSCKMPAHLDYTSGAYINGNSTNYMAGSGVVTSTIASGSAVSLTTGTQTNITSISVPVGTWLITGVVGYVPGAGTTSTYFIQGASSTSATLPAESSYTQFNFATTAFNGTLPIPELRVVVTTATTYYLVADAGFAVGTLGGFGRITATPSL